MNWLTVLGLPALGALATLFGTWWFERRRGAARARYLALRLAVLLERFAALSHDYVLENNQAEHRPGDEFPDWNSRLPELPPFPDDEDGWVSIDHGLAARVLVLPNRIEENQRIIRTVAGFDEEALGWELSEYACEVAIDAWDLATELRSKYGVQVIERGPDYGGILRTLLEAAIQRREQAKERDPTRRASSA